MIQEKRSLISLKDLRFIFTDAQTELHRRDAIAEERRNWERNALRYHEPEYIIESLIHNAPPVKKLEDKIQNRIVKCLPGFALSCLIDAGLAFNTIKDNYIE